MTYTYIIPRIPSGWETLRWTSHEVASWCRVASNPNFVEGKFQLYINWLAAGFLKHQQHLLNHSPQKEKPSPFLSTWKQHQRLEPQSWKKSRIYILVTLTHFPSWNPKEHLKEPTTQATNKWYIFSFHYVSCHQLWRLLNDNFWREIPEKQTIPHPHVWWKFVEQISATCEKKTVLEAQKKDLAIKAHFQHVFNTWCNLSSKKAY